MERRDPMIEKGNEEGVTNGKGKGRRKGGI
jgi:hypothetical protein